jgi:2-amino-4-hydroxy-6-hydroxymethyldihydropteridine diphosphokinase
LPQARQARMLSKTSMELRMTEPSPSRYVLLLGSNAENAEDQLALVRAALQVMSAQPLRVGPARRSIAREGAHIPAYLNQALELHVSLSASTLKRALRHMEDGLGRVRDTSANGVCAIDIDIALEWQPSEQSWQIVDEKTTQPAYAQRALAPWLRESS